MQPENPEDPGKSKETTASAPEQNEQATSRRQALRQGLRAAAAATAALLGGSGAYAQRSGEPGITPLGQSVIAGDRPMQLVLKDLDLVAKTDAFYADLKSDASLQDAFINDPTRVMTQNLLPGGIAYSIPQQQISNANRLLYSIVANDGFRAWARSYQAELEKEGKFDKAQIEKDFAAAVVRYGDSALVQSLMESDNKLKVHGPRMDVVYVYDIAIAIEIVLVLVIVFVGVFGIPMHARFTYKSGDLRLLVERMVARGKELQDSGALEERYER